MEKWPVVKIEVCVCSKESAKSYQARHKKKCAAVLLAGADAPAPRVYRGERGVCSSRAQEMAKTNMARHKHDACL